jgi:putative ABC transport system substrate-binding protein
VQQGVVVSLARPGGNVTGFTISTGPELYGKRLELLREAIPRLNSVMVVWNSRNEASRLGVAAVETAGKTLGLQVEVIGAPGAQELELAFKGAGRSRAGATLTIADALLWSQRERVVSLANRHRLPGMYPEAEFAMAGGLMAYGPKVSDNFRRVAGYVDRILRGTRPADLPVEQPTTFELVINAKTAKTLGLTIPSSLLGRADQVIE